MGELVEEKQGEVRMKWIGVNLLFRGCYGDFLENWWGIRDGLVFQPDDGERREGEEKRTGQSLPRF